MVLSSVMDTQYFPQQFLLPKNVHYTLVSSDGKWIKLDSEACQQWTQLFGNAQLCKSQTTEKIPQVY